MQTLWRSITYRFSSSQPVPRQYKEIFLHLFLDMAWIGVLSGSTVAFLGVYAARLGATPGQIGLLNAVPALVNLVLAIPSGRWMHGRRLGRVAFWSSVGARIFYLGFVFLPLFFSPAVELWVIILITLVMNIPLTVLNVSFNAFVIEAVPSQWRAYVVGGRNGLLSVVALCFTLICGQILNGVTFPLGYQIVFGIGFLGAAMSSLHLFFLGRLEPRQSALAAIAEDSAGLAREGVALSRNSPEINRYFRVLLLFFGFHISQWLVIPVVPLFTVNYLKLNDFQIGVGSAIFNLVVFIGSFYLSKVTGRFGNHRTTAFSMMGLGIFPALLALSRGFPFFMVAQFVGGISWSILAGAMFNYLADNLPSTNRAGTFSWYILVSNGAILIGSLLGPQFINWLGYPGALLCFSVLRILAGWATLRWG